MTQENPSSPIILQTSLGTKQSQEVLLPVTSGETARSPPDGEPVATGGSLQGALQSHVCQSHRDLGSHPAVVQIMLPWIHECT